MIFTSLSGQPWQPSPTKAKQRGTFNNALQLQEADIQHSTAASTIYRFLVGPEKEEFFIHSALFAHHSAVLEAVISSGFKESIEKTMKWDDIHVQTFVSFWQFLYTGTYDDNFGQSSSGQGLFGQSSFGQSSFGQGSPRRSAFGKPGDSGKKDLWRKFGSVRELMLKFLVPVTDADGVTAEDQVVGNYPDDFIHHARVFIFAERYDIRGLMTIAFQRLHRALLDYRLEVDGPVNVVKLLEFCYENPTHEGLRELVALYAACKFKELWACHGFNNLVETSGDFTRTVMSYVVQRID